MISDNISMINQEKDKLEQNVRDTFGTSILQNCYEPIISDVNIINQCYESSKTEETTIKSMLSALRLIL